MRQENVLESWAAELGRVLAETTGSEPVIRKVPFDSNEARPEMIWWRASGKPSVTIGITEKDSKSLTPALAELLDRSWGAGEMTAAPKTPADAPVWEVWNVQFVTGSNVRFFVAPEVMEAIDTEPVNNLEMLMDIELPIVIRFGHTQMALRDIAGLSAGSVIEFQRGIDEPVEVMVNGHVVALGEAIAVKGSYGIRISEISSRRERLATSSSAIHGQSL